MKPTIVVFPKGWDAKHNRSESIWKKKVKSTMFSLALAAKEWPSAYENAISFQAGQRASSQPCQLVNVPCFLLSYVVWIWDWGVLWHLSEQHLGMKYCRGCQVAQVTMAHDFLVWTLRGSLSLCAIVSSSVKRASYHPLGWMGAAQDVRPVWSVPCPWNAKHGPRSFSCRLLKPRQDGGSVGFPVTWPLWPGPAFSQPKVIFQLT